MGHAPEGFGYVVRGDVVRGDVVSGATVTITHRGQTAATLRGSAATGFLARVAEQDPQELMARVTGHYRRGNERVARNHPRNR